MPAPGAAPAPTAAPVYSSRREARAAGILSADPAGASAQMPAAQAPAAQVPAAQAQSTPAYDGIASLFPLLGEVTSSPVASELAAPSAFDALVAAAPPTAAAPASPAPTAAAPTAAAPAAVPAPTADLGATQAIPAAEIAAELATPVAPYVVPQSAPVPIVPSWHAGGAAVAPAASASVAADPFVATRRVHAAPSRPTRRAAPTRRRADSAAGEAGAKPLRQRLFGVGVMVLVGGLFAVLALPAYADNDAATLHAAAAVQTQKLAVEKDAASTVTASDRDAYTATSAADLKSMYAAAMREQNIAAYLQSGAKAKGDDYPWYAELSRNQGGGLSPLGYYYRECVDFVAWRLNRDAGTTSAPFKWTWSKLTPNGGDGHQWKAAWLAHGWPTGTTPVPGSVAWFGNNHVGYVNGILDNGQVLIEEYNYVPHAYSTRVINASQAYYLYAPPG